MKQDATAEALADTAADTPAAEFDAHAESYEDDHRSSIAASGEDPAYFHDYKVAGINAPSVFSPSPSPPNASSRTTSTAATIASTAIANSRISRRDWRRATSCCWKKFRRKPSVPHAWPGQ